jgi:proliferating cell nuclear antigen PCNA
MSDSPSSSEGSAAAATKYIFKAKTKDSFVIKVLSELLSNSNIKWAPFCIDSEGISLKQTDGNKHLLISFKLHRENFTLGYRCARPLNFLISSNTLCKLLKSTRKREIITLFITEKEDDKLGICVETSDENNKTIDSVRITYHQPVDYKEPEGYPSPTIVTNKEFQKMKNLHNISKVMTVTSPQPGLVLFFCDGQEVYDRKVQLGIADTDEDTRDPDYEPYHQTFNTTYITGLTKCANQSPKVAIYIEKKLPLKIKMHAGSLGELSVYIKRKERIAMEQKVLAEAEAQNNPEATVVATSASSVGTSY